MKAQHKVSVIMPAYNAAEYIKEAIDSILAQTYTNFELIVINDGSSDSTEEIIHTFEDPRIMYIKNEANRGIAFSTNKGIEASDGVFIALMDSDDVSFPDRLEKQVAIMNENSEVGICGGACLIMGSNQRWTFPREDEQLRVALLHYYPFRNPTLLFRRSVFDKMKDWYREEFTYTLDYDFIERLIQYTKAVNTDECLIYYRVHEKQTSTLKHDIIVAQSNEIQIRQLIQNLNISLTEEESKYHIELLKKICSSVSMDVLERNLLWINRLRSSNNKINYYSKKEFEALLKEMNVICIGIRMGIKFPGNMLLPFYFSNKKHWKNAQLTWKEHLRFIIKSIF